MHYTLPIRKFAYDKIVDGSKKIEMRIRDIEVKNLKLNDTIEFVCDEHNERVVCLVHGIASFETFNDLIYNLPVELFGYKDKEEVKIRINRLYSNEEQLTNHVIGIFILPLQIRSLEKDREGEYLKVEGREKVPAKLLEREDNER